MNDRDTFPSHGNTMATFFFNFSAPGEEEGAGPQRASPLCEAAGTSIGVTAAKANVAESELDNIWLETGEVRVLDSTIEDTLNKTTVEKHGALLRVSGFKDGFQQSKRGLAEVIEKTDVLTGFYEGGFKTWECANDLVEYIKTLPHDFFPNGLKPRVLELGCGNGFPAIQAYWHFCCSKVVFQDLNREVLGMCTAPNMALNVKAKLESTGGSWRNYMNSDSVQLWSGDWLSLLHHPEWQQDQFQFDLILSADTIYGNEQISKLTQFLCWLLTRNPKCIALIAAKRFYFGTGGSVETFLVELKTRSNGKIQGKSVFLFEDKSSNIREIVQVSNVAHGEKDSY